MWDGSSWSPAPSPGSAVIPSEVSCPTKHFCMAVGASGLATTYTSSS